MSDVQSILPRNYYAKHYREVPHPLAPEMWKLTNYLLIMSYVFHSQPRVTKIGCQPMRSQLRCEYTSNHMCIFTSAEVTCLNHQWIMASAESVNSSQLKFALPIRSDCSPWLRSWILDHKWIYRSAEIQPQIRYEMSSQLRGSIADQKWIYSSVVGPFPESDLHFHLSWDWDSLIRPVRSAQLRYFPGGGALDG